MLVFDGRERASSAARSRCAGRKDADALLERLAAERRGKEQVAIVSSDTAVRGTAGIEVRKLASQSFLAELARPSQPPATRGDLRDRIDPDTLAQLERLRRGES